MRSEKGNGLNGLTRTKKSPRESVKSEAEWAEKVKGAGFRKQERIVSKKLMDELFKNGHSQSLTVFPLRAVYQVAESIVAPSGAERGASGASAQILVSVPKRHFKHAVDRNRAKRQVREAYRLNKQLLLASQLLAARHFSIAFIWLSNEPQPSPRVTHSVKTILSRITNNYELRARPEGTLR